VTENSNVRVEGTVRFTFEKQGNLGVLDGEAAALVPVATLTAAVAAPDHAGGALPAPVAQASSAWRAGKGERGKSIPGTGAGARGQQYPTPYLRRCRFAVT
jgi:hypothetical protein